MLFVVPFNHTISEFNSQKNYSKKALALFKASFASSNISRKFPLLSSLHRGIDGALVGVIISGAVMSGLALHSQHLWTLNFSRLHLTRDLIHRVQESTAILERYFLAGTSTSNSMVATKSSHLIYIDKPRERKTPIKDFLSIVYRDITSLSHPISNGY